MRCQQQSHVTLQALQVTLQLLLPRMQLLHAALRAKTRTTDHWLAEAQPS